ncbi:PEP-CTERM sorting domain-containing protein [Tautonia plasticadhaerens]|uniref:Ice-binding protein C-terminal domain-containing protein n=1 Tax=Tautonia plasticadhaerens TaxID=2527974 RepID=A0A518H5J2_9BACT|nr:PEP-CTERM sorting domain-containing protein [Tautonia plasticadhaerens]QDV36100.1 hypothetical protein ElP_40120 [Tautonia plasticadhaerens]
MRNFVQMTAIAALAAALASASPAVAGPFDPQAGLPGSLAISRDDSRIVGWGASVAELVRGPQDLADPGGPLASFGSAADAIGAADGRIVSLGDGGSITLGFDAPIVDGAGADFAVFENGFGLGGGLAFLELAFVEVSSNGVDFFRFDAASLTQTSTQVGGFGALDATELHNLAGKHVGGFGTPFDLAELAGRSPLLDVDAVRYVRLVDVVGSIDPGIGSLDSLGNLVNDPYPTPFASGGFDLDAVGVLHAIPEPSSLAMAAAGLSAAGVAVARRRRSPRAG